MLVEWLASGAEAVPQEQATGRGQVCAGCSLNEPGDLSNFFTRAASEAIRKALNTRREWKLETALDKKLGVCGACLCPLKLKVHLPIDRILAKILPESLDYIRANAPGCWLLKETPK